MHKKSTKKVNLFLRGSKVTLCAFAPLRLKEIPQQVLFYHLQSSISCFNQWPDGDLTANGILHPDLGNKFSCRIDPDRFICKILSFEKTIQLEIDEMTHRII